MDLSIEWTPKLAMQYFQDYAKFEKEDLEECIVINNSSKIRADVGAAELEYLDNGKLLIVRGLIDKDIYTSDPDFKAQILKRLYAYNNVSEEMLDGAYFELDTTAYELQKNYPERLNLRLDFRKPVSRTEFIKRVDALMDEAYQFSSNEYSYMIYEIHDYFFPKEPE